MLEIPLTCPDKVTPVMVGRNPRDNIAIMFRPRCKMWSCSVCAPINKRFWTARAWHGAETIVGADDGAELHFLTLTSLGGLTPAQSLYVFPKAWKKLHARARYRQPGYHYFMVPERQQSGRVHMHAITTLAMSTRWWKDNGAACGLGWRNENEPCRNPLFAAWYASKYLAKSIEVSGWPKGFRRTRLSRNWPKLPPQSDLPDWVFRILSPRDDPGGEYERLIRAGYNVKILSGVEAWDVVAQVSGDGSEQKNGK